MTDASGGSPKPRVVSLRDEPAKSDLFGGHDRIAGAIAELVESEPGGRTIGLEGPWGSGKSTVVELLRDHVGDSTGVFVYNTWAHDGDPLRRSFLEDLGDYLASEENGSWIDAEKWAKRKLELSGQTRQTETTSRVTANGRWLISSLLLAPVGLILLNFWAALPDHRTAWGATGFAIAVFPIILAYFLYTLAEWPFLAKLSAIFTAVSVAGLVGQLSDGFQVDWPTVLYGLGVMILVSVGLVSRTRKGDGVTTAPQPRWHGGADTADTTHGRNHPAEPSLESDPWALLVRAGVIESMRSESYDPTSLEFEGIFSELVIEALSGDKQRRLVVVLDNLDRVSTLIRPGGPWPRFRFSFL